MDDRLLYLGALALVFLIPGPDMLLLLQTGARHGRQAAFATALGLALARACHVALAAVGLATLFKVLPCVRGGQAGRRRLSALARGEDVAASR